MAHKGNNSQIWVRIIAFILAALMVLSIAGTCIFYLLAK